MRKHSVILDALWKYKDEWHWWWRLITKRQWWVFRTGQTGFRCGCQLKPTWPWAGHRTSFWQLLLLQKSGCDFKMITDQSTLGFKSRHSLAFRVHKPLTRRDRHVPVGPCVCWDSATLWWHRRWPSGGGLHRLRAACCTGRERRTSGLTWGHVSVVGGGGSAFTFHQSWSERPFCFHVAPGRRGSIWVCHLNAVTEEPSKGSF